GLLKVADADLEDELRRAIRSGDDYASASKPQIDWDDQAARDGLVDSRAKDAHACLAVLDGRALAGKVEEAAHLLATVVGQDLEEDGSGTFRIARKVATDRVISVVDPEARHGHKTQARSFDGYKGHVAMDPDSEIITDTAVTPGNAGDAAVAEDLISDLLGDYPETTADDVGNGAEAERSEDRAASPEGGEGDGDEVPTVYGDNAYGTGDFQSRLEGEGIESKCKTQ
ncbi:MAG: transposase, partial [Acidimicrobiales bacterium]